MHEPQVGHVIIYVAVDYEVDDLSAPLAGSFT